MTTRYIITFDRIGRTRPDRPTSFDVESADHLAEAIHAHACKRLRSQDFDVTVDLSAGCGWIEAGRFGKFTVETVWPAPS